MRLEPEGQELLSVGGVGEVVKSVSGCFYRVRFAHVVHNLNRFLSEANTLIFAKPPETI